MQADVAIVNLRYRLCAVGDVLEVPEGKYADVKGMQHANDTLAIVALNTAQLLRFGEANKQKLRDFAWSDKPIVKPMMTCLGENHAVGDMGLPFPLGNFLGRKVKCKNYYVSIQGGKYGTDVPTPCSLQTITRLYALI